MLEKRTPSGAFSLFSEDGLTAILNGIGEGFYAVDREWRILLFNNGAAEHFKCGAEEVIGRVLWDVFPGARDTELGALFLRTMQSRDTIRFETESVIFAGRWLAAISLRHEGTARLRQNVLI